MAQNSPENKSLETAARETLQREKFSTGSERGDERVAAHLVQYAMEKMAHLEQQGEAGRAEQLMQAKVVDLKSAAEAHAESMEQDSADAEQQEAQPQNLEEPAAYRTTEDISKGLNVHQSHMLRMQERVAEMGKEVSAAQELVQRASQPEPSFFAFMRYARDVFVDSPATRKAREELKKKQDAFETAQKEFQSYLSSMEARSDRLQKAPDGLQDEARREYEAQKLALKQGQKKAGQEAQARKQEQEELEETRLALHGHRLMLEEAGKELTREGSASGQAAEALEKHQQTIIERQQELEAGKTALESAIAQMPKGPQRDGLIQRLQDLVAGKQQLSQKKSEMAGAEQTLEERQAGAAKTQETVEGQASQIASSIQDADTAMTALAETESVLLGRQIELAASEADLDRFFGEKMNILQGLDVSVAEGVLAVEEQSYRISTQLNMQAAQVKGMEILGPGLLDSLAATRPIPGVGLSMSEISHLPGISHALYGLKTSGKWLGENVFSPVWGATVGNVVKGWGMIFDAVDQYVIANIPGQKGFTMGKRLDAMAEIPVLDFFAGVLQSGGEMVKGIGTMIQHPVDTMGGLVAALNHPSVLVKGMVRADEWSSWYSTGKPPLGKMLGQTFVDAGMTLVGGGAATKGVSAGRLAYTGARGAGVSVGRAAARASWEGTKIFGKTLSHDLGHAASAPGRAVQWGREMLQKASAKEALTAAAKTMDDVLKDPNLSPEERRTQALQAARDAVNLDNYVGIFDIAKAFGKAKGEKLLSAGLQMDEALELAYAAMKKSGKKAGDIMDVRHTLGNKPPRKFKQPKNAPNNLPDTPNISPEAMKQLRKSVQEQRNVPVEKILEGIPDPAERHLLDEVWKSLDELLPDAPDLLSHIEKRVIFQYTLGYFQDYREAMRIPGFPKKNPEQLYQLLQENQRRLAHQIANDKHYFTGSDHGVKHLLEGNMNMAESLMNDLGGAVTPAERIQVRQALIDHDMGYTNWELMKKEGMEFFAMSKDHPIYSTAFIESRKSWYVEHFGEEGFKNIRDAVLDHSRAKAVFTGKGKELVEAIVSTVDCLGVTADVKLATFFSHPEVVGELARIRAVWDAFKDASGKITPQGLQKVENARKRLLKFVDESPYDAKTKAAYRNAIESNLQAETSLFTVNTQFGQMIGGLGGVGLTPERKLRVVFTIDDNQALIREMFGDSTGNASFNKALEDFGLPRDIGKPPGKYPELEAKLAALKRGEGVTIETSKGVFEFRKSVQQNIFSRRVREVLSRNYSIRTMLGDLEKLTVSGETSGIHRIQLRYHQITPYVDKAREIVLQSGEKIKAGDLLRRHEEMLVRYLQGQQVDLQAFHKELLNLLDQGLKRIELQRAA